MADWTCDKLAKKLLYEYSDRAIYNDIRAEIGTTTSETVVDADPTYEWKVWDGHAALGPPGYLTIDGYYTATLEDPVSWQLEGGHSAWDYSFQPYYDYDIKIISTNDPSTKAVEIKNTGSAAGGQVYYVIKYKYLASEAITHEEHVQQTLSVRAVDNDSIRKYGRRVMNMAWPQGTSPEQMQTIVNAVRDKYCEPWPVLKLTIEGDTNEKATQIFDREISDTIAVVSDALGMTSTTFYIDSIKIKANEVNTPIGTFGLVQQRTQEAAGWFLIDTDWIDGTKLIG